MEWKTNRLTKQALSMALILTALLILTAGAFAETGPVPGHVNINTADSGQLAALPGIGQSKAQAIVKHRSEHGPFQTVDSLANVRGIGVKLMEKIRPYISTSNE